MLHLIPAPLHRRALQLAYTVRHRWRRLARLPLEGVSVLVTDSEGRLLLVRHSYGPQAWLLPGGGVKRGEAPEQAARREIAEEMGLDLQSVTLIDSVEEVISGSRHTAHIVTARTLDEPRPDRREVMTARFFPAHSLPEPQTPLTRARIARWLEHER